MRVNSLLLHPTTSTSTTLCTTVPFFRHKVKDMQTAMSAATSPDIQLQPTNNLCHISPVSCSKVAKILVGTPSKSCALDPMPTRMVKKIKMFWFPSSAICANCCAIFPTSQKQAIIIPRLKKSTLNPDHVTSHRPISNLSFTSKLVECVIASRFVQHAEDNHLVPTRQSSYCQGHSTETVMLCVYNNLVQAIDSKIVTALVSLDLSSAYDTVNHSTLLTVLNRHFLIKL